MLVGDNELGPADQRARHLDALLLTRELPDRAGGQLGREIECVEEAPRLGGDVGTGLLAPRSTFKDSALERA